PVGLVRGADLDAGPVEVDLAEGPVPGVGEAAAAEHLEDPRRALDAHVAGVAVGGGDHGVVARVGDSGLDEVLGAGAGLAPAAAGEDEPDVPVAVGAALVGSGGGERAGEEAPGD